MYSLKSHQQIELLNQRAFARAMLMLLTNEHTGPIPGAQQTQRTCPLSHELLFHLSRQESLLRSIQELSSSRSLIKNR